MFKTTTCSISVPNLEQLVENKENMMEAQCALDYHVPRNKKSRLDFIRLIMLVSLLVTIGTGPCFRSGPPVDSYGNLYIVL